MSLVFSPIIGKYSKEQYCSFCGGPTIQPLRKIQCCLLKNEKLREKFCIDEDECFDDDKFKEYAWLDNISVIAYDNKVYHNGRVNNTGKISFNYRSSIDIDMKRERKGFIVHTVCWTLAGKPKITDVSNLLNMTGRIKHKKLKKYQKETFDMMSCLDSDNYTFLQDPRKNEDNKERILKIVSSFKTKI